MTPKLAVKVRRQFGKQRVIRWSQHSQSHVTAKASPLGMSRAAGGPSRSATHGSSTAPEDAKPLGGPIALKPTANQHAFSGSGSQSSASGQINGRPSSAIILRRTQTNLAGS